VRKSVLAGVSEFVVAKQMLRHRQAAMQHRQPDDLMRAGELMRAGDMVRDNRNRQEIPALQIVT